MLRNFINNYSKIEARKILRILRFGPFSVSPKRLLSSTIAGAMSIQVDTGGPSPEPRKGGNRGVLALAPAARTP